MKLNTHELVERIAAEQGVSKDHTRKVIDSVLAAIAVLPSRPNGKVV